MTSIITTVIGAASGILAAFTAMFVARAKRERDERQDTAMIIADAQKQTADLLTAALQPDGVTLHASMTALHRRLDELSDSVSERLATLSGAVETLDDRVTAMETAMTDAHQALAAPRKRRVRR